MKRTVVTADKYFADIDILACTIAYSELLNYLNRNALAVIPGELNASIPEEVSAWDLKFVTSYDKSEDDEFIIVDRSENLEVFPDFVDKEKIVQIIDHHLKHRSFWKKKLGDKAIIESVGSCATLIWEKFKENRLENKITRTSAKLLYTAILSNTLNFRAFMTDDRDTQASNELLKISGLPDNWHEIYFKGCEIKLLKNPKQAIENDIKTIKLKSGEKITVGQVELWNSREFITENQDLIAMILSRKKNEMWFMSSPSISERVNYLFTTNLKVQKLLEEGIDAEFSGNIGRTKSLWLRKELEI